MNRVAAAIQKTQVAVDAMDDEKRAEVDATFAVSFEEHFAFQQTQAEAHASGILTPEEAQIVYIALGEVGSDSNGGWAEGTSTATKYVVSKLISELLGRKLAAR